MMCQAVDPIADTAAAAAVSGFIVAIEVGQLVLSWLRKLLSSCCCCCCHRLQLVHMKLISELYANAAKGSNTDHLATLVTWLLLLHTHTHTYIRIRCHCRRQCQISQFLYPSPRTLRAAHNCSNCHYLRFNKLFGHESWNQLVAHSFAAWPASA